MTTSDFQKQVLKHERFQSAMTGVQTGMSAMQLAASTVMNRQLSDIRQQNADALAMHQEMLAKEELQAQLEEFIYASQKMLDSFNDPSCDVALVARYVRTRTIVENVDDWGLDTSIIRGRENKAAFEKMLQQAKTSVSRLESTSKEVQDALAQAKAEHARLEQEREALRAKNAARKIEIEREIATLNEQRWTLDKDDYFHQNDVDQSIENILNGQGIGGKLLRFSDWFTHVFVWLIYGFVWIPIAFVLRKDRALDARQWYRRTISSQMETVNRKIVTPIARSFWSAKYEGEKKRLEVERNQDVDRRIAALRQELASIEESTSGER